MTAADLKDWAYRHLLAARVTRRVCPEFNPMLMLHCGSTDVVAMMPGVPKSQVATAILAAIRQEQPDAVALVLDTWLAERPDPPPYRQPVRQMPGRTDALAVMAMLATGERAFWYVRYGQDAQHRVTWMREPEYGGDTVVSPFLPDPWKGVA